MLVRRQRLAKEKDFKRIFKQGRAYYTKRLGIKVLANGFEFNRFGIIISAKISKKATIRNKIKRRIRQAINKLDKQLMFGFDFAIMVLPGLLNSDYKEIEGELEKTFAKLKLFV